MTNDLETLQGQWRQTMFEENGEIDPPDTHGAVGAIMTIAGNSFHVAVPGGETLIEGNFSMDSSAYPKHIDWIDSIGEDAGKTFPAIYTLTPDSFAFAAADEDMARPDDFSGGNGVTIRAFVRA